MIIDDGWLMIDIDLWALFRRARHFHDIRAMRFLMTLYNITTNKARFDASFFTFHDTRSLVPRHDACRFHYMRGLAAHYYTYRRLYLVSLISNDGITSRALEDIRFILSHENTRRYSLRYMMLRAYTYIAQWWADDWDDTHTLYYGP